MLKRIIFKCIQNIEMNKVGMPKFGMNKIKFNFQNEIMKNFIKKIKLDKI